MGHADRAEHVEHVVHAACPRGGPHLPLRRLQYFVGHAQLHSGILKDSLPVWCLADAAGRVQAKGSFGCLGILGNQCSHLLPPLKTVAACPESFVTHPSVGRRGGMWGGRGGWVGVGGPARRGVPSRKTHSEISIHQPYVSIFHNTR